ncbi:MAG: OmpH family outer membrane protein [Cytophagaceae bacterium]|jgi:outer membrane protein|nr:OmpH family outer membrane protein [Cytophagaceae bacterium]
MKTIKFVFAGVLLLMVSMTYGQELKFGHVNSQQLVSELPEYISAMSSLESEAKVLQDRRTVMQEEAQRKYTEYLTSRDSLPELVRATMEKDIQDLQQRLENYDLLAQQTIGKKQQDLLQPILEKINKAIEDAGAENGFIYIFDVSTPIILYHSDKSIDCSEIIKKKLGITN